MKGSCTLVASMLAASTVALSSAGDTDVSLHPCSSFEGSNSSTGKQNKNSAASACTASSDKEKFAPRFDGLRFIETLVTAHR